VPLFDGGVQAHPAEEELVEPNGEKLTSEPETPANEKGVEGENAKGDTSQSVAPVPDVSGVGKEIHAAAYSLTLQGRTDATFRAHFVLRGSELPRPPDALVAMPGTAFECAARWSQPTQLLRLLLSPA